MTTAQVGNKVRVVFQPLMARQKKNKKEIEFVVGEHQVLPGLENAVLGMQEGESKDVTIPAKYAYGPRRSELVIELRKSQLPSGVAAEVGKELDLRTSQGERKHVKVTSVTDHTVVLDANHPMAGKPLKLHVELLTVH